MRVLWEAADKVFQAVFRWLRRAAPGVLGLAALLGLFAFFWWQEANRAERGSDADLAGSGAVEIYFTSPGSEAARLRQRGPDAPLVEAIDAAAFLVDVAAYRLDLWSVRDALLRAQRRGATVRLVVEGDHRDEPEIRRLEGEGIPVASDAHHDLMHHKFVIVDGLEVWTGSMNFTLHGTFRNNNNLLRIQSRAAAESFTCEFEEMFLEGRFGALSRRDTPKPQFRIEDLSGEILFSPEDGVQDRVLALIESAQEEIVFMAYAFTIDPLAEAMIRKAGEGVRVRGLLERDQAGASGGEYERLRAAGVDVRLDRNPYNMHHKVVIMDGRVVITGSYNFTRSAEERNDENVVILHDPWSAAAYLQEFERLFQEAGN